MSVLEAVLLGAAYPLGLVRAAEEAGTGRTVVQLTPLGRYVLALGPTPPPRATFEQFLFVQPNFEVIAYRQGLTPQLVGRLSRFAWWSQIGAALELKLTRESIVHGLDGGLTAEIDPRDLDPAQPAGAAARHHRRRHKLGQPPRAGDLLRGRHADRIRLDRRARSRRFRPGRRRDVAAPIAVAERFLLVEDEKTVPFDRLRLISSRDYRRPPEICVLVEPDGVTHGARSGSLGPAGRGRAGPVCRNIVLAATRFGDAGLVGDPKVRGHSLVITPGCQPRHVTTAARGMVRQAAPAARFPPPCGCCSPPERPACPS